MEDEFDDDFLDEEEEMMLKEQAHFQPLLRSLLLSFSPLTLQMSHAKASSNPYRNPVTS